MKLLLTAFEPFGGSDMNPAQDAVGLIPDRIGDTEIVKIDVPVVFGEAIRAAARRLRRSG